MNSEIIPDTSIKRRDAQLLMPLTYLLVSSILVIARFALGASSGSKSLMVSALCSLLVAFSACIRVIEIRFSRNPPQPDYPYGQGKIQLLVVGTMSVLIFAGVASMGGAILHSWFEHRQRPPENTALWAAILCAFAITVTNLVSIQLAKESSNNFRRKYDFHARTDVILSIIVALSVVIARTGMVLVDSVVAVAIALYVTIYAGKMLHHAVKGLLDASIGRDKITLIADAVKQTEGVHQVESIKGIQTAGKIVVKLTLALPPKMIMTQAQRLKRRIAETIQQQEMGVGQVLVKLRALDENSNEKR